MRSYIIVFKESASENDINECISRITGSGGKITHNYDTLMKAIAVQMDDTFVQSFSQDDAVDFVELDGIATIQGGAGIF